MTTDLDHIVYTADDPEVAILVALGGVAGGVLARVLGPVLLYIPVGIAIDRAQHRRPGILEDEITFCVIRDRVPLFVHDLCFLPEERTRPRTGLERHCGSWRDHEHAGLSLPPGIHDRAAFLANHAVVPLPRLRVDRLTDRA